MVFHALPAIAQSEFEDCMGPPLVMPRNSTENTVVFKMRTETTCHYTFSSVLAFPDSLQISARAKHGFVGVNRSINGSGFAYRPDRAFIGQDNFVITWQGKKRWESERHLVVLHVEIDVGQ